MAPGREHDAFERMRLTARLERDREIIGRYEEGLAYHRRRVEETQYALGRLDERLEGTL